MSRVTLNTVTGVTVTLACDCHACDTVTKGMSIEAELGIYWILLGWCMFELLNIKNVPPYCGLYYMTLCGYCVVEFGCGK